MKYSNLLKSAAGLLMLVAVGSSCKKSDTVTPIGTAGQTIIKLVSTQGNLEDPGFTDLQKSSVEIKLVDVPVTYDVVDVRRDAPNTTKFNTTVVVKVKADPGIVSSYNSYYGTSFVSLPDSLITVNSANPLIGNTYTVTLNPNEFVKTLKLSLKSGKALDLNKSYALGFVITSVDGDGTIAATQRKVIVEFGVKNKWDGIYQVTGTLVDVTNAGFVGTYPLTFHLITTGGNTCNVYDPNLNGGYFGHSFDAAGTPSYYGSYMPVVTFDDPTSKVVGVTNYWGQGSGPSVRSAALDPTGLNTVSANKDIDIKYLMIQGTGAAFVGTRVTFTEHWKYMGPR